MLIEITDRMGSGASWMSPENLYHLHKLDRASSSQRDKAHSTQVNELRRAVSVAVGRSSTFWSYAKVAHAEKYIG